MLVPWSVMGAKEWCLGLRKHCPAGPAKLVSKTLEKPSRVEKIGCFLRFSTFFKEILFGSSIMSLIRVAVTVTVRIQECSECFFTDEFCLPFEVWKRGFLRTFLQIH